MAIYHKSTNKKVKVGDEVAVERAFTEPMPMTVFEISEYTHKGARLRCGIFADSDQRGMTSWYMASSCDCFHSTGDDDVFNGV